MAAHLVHHQHHAFGAAHGVERFDAGIQAIEHGGVGAFAFATQTGQLQRARVRIGHAVTNASATRLVVDPQDREAGALQHIEQVFFMRRLVAAIIAGERGEHAGHGNLGIGAAGSHIAEIHQIALGLPLGKFGGGRARVAIELPVLGPRGFTHDHHQQRATRLRGIARAQLRVFTHLLQGTHLARHLLHQQLRMLRAQPTFRIFCNATSFAR